MKESKKAMEHKLFIDSVSDLLVKQRFVQILSNYL